MSVRMVMDSNTLCCAMKSLDHHYNISSLAELDYRSEDLRENHLSNTVVDSEYRRSSPSCRNYRSTVLGCLTVLFHRITRTRGDNDQLSLLS